jgi:hypothetical protein
MSNLFEKSNANFSYRVFGLFPARARGGRKQYRNISKRKFGLVTSWPLTHPPTTGVSDFFWWQPLSLLAWDVICLNKFDFFLLLICLNKSKAQGAGLLPFGA